MQNKRTGDPLELNNISRRDALRIFAGAGLATVLPRVALAVDQKDVDSTNAQIEETKKQVAKVQSELDDIAAEYEKLSKKQSDTLDQIEQTQGKITDVEKDISEKEDELSEKKERLAKRVSESYQAGSTGFLDVLFSSASFEELESNVYYMDKISESDSRMIQEVKDLKAELVSQRDTLREQKEMESKQAETQSVLAGLSDQEKKLMDQRDSELAAMAKEKAEQAAAAKAAAAAAAARNSGAGAANVTGTISGGGATTGSQQAVVNACHTTPSPGLGLCAMWVSQVFSNAGYGYASGNACDMYNAWCTSSNRGDLKPGMIVAVSSHAHTSAGRIYGHIGIYVGGGVTMDNVGYIRTINVNEWIAYYGTTVTPRWGWLMGIKLA